ncbi:MAG: hypothetical protein RLZ89_364 [Pseudomonadota bacterium]
MASKEPPLIRSSKAFSVEIPEGSSSAKSRKSDVVAGLEEGFSPLDPHFEASSMLFEQDHVSENDILHDPSVKVSTDQPSRDSNSTFTQESITDHLVGVAEDGLQDHVVAVSNDSSQDHYAGLAQDNLVDNHASLPDEAIEDRVESVAEPEAPIPLFVSADDDFPDDHMEIEYPPDVDPNVQALSDEALVDHVEQVKEESVVRAQADLPNVTAVAQQPVNTKPAQQPQALVKKSPQLLTQDMVKQHKAELLARQQRKEEFHGRVEAIRNTVNNINAKLDHMSPTESKPTSH